MKQKRIMIIAHFCDYGDEQSNNRFNYIAQMLTEYGFVVELVTSSFSHRQKTQRRQVADEKYKTTLIYEPSYRKNVSLKRLLFSHRRMASNLRTYLKTAETPDVVYCAIPSIQVAEIAAEYAQMNNLRFIIDVQDLWPEAYRLIIKNEILYNVVTCAMKRRVDAVYAAADDIIAVSEKYAERAKSVNKKAKNCFAIYLGTNLNAFDYAVKTGDILVKKESDEVLLAYCGTLGTSYDLDVFFEALKSVPPQKYKFVIMGSGPREEEFRKRASDLNINAIFTGFLPYSDMCATLAYCDVAINPITKGAAQSVINKHGDYAMAGLPTVSTQEYGEYSRLLDKYRCGINCNVDHPDEIYNALMILFEHKELRQQYGENARKMAEEKFNREVIYRAILKLL